MGCYLTLPRSLLAELGIKWMVKRGESGRSFNERPRESGHFRKIPSQAKLKCIILGENNAKQKILHSFPCSGSSL